MQLAKTQFLVEPSGRIRTFKRAKVGMLFCRGVPTRLCEYADYRELKKTWPDLVARDSVRHAYVWTLVETTSA